MPKFRKETNYNFHWE